jgi:hypothetical protein
MARKISEYQEHADQCRLLAKNAVTPEHAAMLENMAQTWEGLAKEREKILARQERIANLNIKDEPPSEA